MNYYSKSTLLSVFSTTKKIYWGPMMFECLTQDRTSRKECSPSKSRPSDTVPVHHTMRQPILHPHPATVPVGQKRWGDEGRFFYICSLWPPYVVVIREYGGVLSRKEYCRWGYLSVHSGVILSLWERTCLQNILRISLMNLSSFPRSKQKGGPEFFPILSSSIMIVLEPVAGWLVVETLT